ncbi:MAG: hypothetical protein AAF483_09255 [Planctomycetota bacterium]
MKKGTATADVTPAYFRLESIVTESEISLSREQQQYTPAMLADLVEVSVRTIRRWKRAGLLKPSSEVMQLPHFDFVGLTIARQLAGWSKQGVTVSSMQMQLEALRERCGDDLSIDQLPIEADGQRLILRHEDQLFESSGQLRFGFEQDDESEEHDFPATLKFQSKDSLQEAKRGYFSHDMPLTDMIEEAILAEDADDTETAIRWYRLALTAHGLNADICFQLAELLYRQGDVCGARERYFMALEIDPNLLEARANLGCVLAECHQLDLAIAAFEGALEQYSDYADVHFHMARALDDHGESGRAAEHWQRFLELSPSSPWAEEAQRRLSEHVPLEFLVPENKLP